MRCATRACSDSSAHGLHSICLFGVGSLSIVGEDQSIAWQAHVGGFLAGLLLFALFDPVGPEADFDDDEEAPHIAP